MKKMKTENGHYSWKRISYKCYYILIEGGFSKYAYKSYAVRVDLDGVLYSRFTRLESIAI